MTNCDNPGPIIALIVNHLIILAILLFSMFQVANGNSEHRDVFLNVLSLIIGVYIPSPNLRRGRTSADSPAASVGAHSSYAASSFTMNSPNRLARSPDRLRSPNRVPPGPPLHEAEVSGGDMSDNH